MRAVVLSGEGRAFSVGSDVREFELDAGWLKRRMFHHFMAVAKRCGSDILDGKPVGLLDRLHYALGNLLVEFDP